MAIKYFCDACNKEIPQSANQNVFILPFPQRDGSTVRVGVEAMVTIGATTNGGHICNDCIRKTVAEGHISRKELL